MSDASEKNVRQADDYITDPAIVQRVRAISPESDQELERIYWEGVDRIPGSVIQALYPLIKRHPDADDAEISRLALEDEDRMRLLRKNLEWKAKKR